MALGADLNAPSVVLERQKSLHHASDEVRVDVVQVLLECENTCSFCGYSKHRRTALFRAAVSFSYHREEVARLLTAAGANVNAVDKDHRRALSALITERSHDDEDNMLRFLLQ